MTVTGNAVITGNATTTGYLDIGPDVSTRIRQAATNNLQVTTMTANATSTLTVGWASQNKGSCLELYTSNGTAIYAYVAAGATTFTLSSVSCK